MAAGRVRRTTKTNVSTETFKALWPKPDEAPVVIGGRGFNCQRARELMCLPPASKLVSNELLVGRYKGIVLFPDGVSWWHLRQEMQGGRNY